MGYCFGGSLEYYRTVEDDKVNWARLDQPTDGKNKEHIMAYMASKCGSRS